MSDTGSVHRVSILILTRISVGQVIRLYPCHFHNFCCMKNIGKNTLKKPCQLILQHEGKNVENVHFYLM